jgi:hypothetical protein
MLDKLSPAPTASPTTPATAVQEQQVAIATIVREPTLMMRAQLNDGVVKTYATAMSAGVRAILSEGMR